MGTLVFEGVEFTTDTPPSPLIVSRLSSGVSVLSNLATSFGPTVMHRVANSYKAQLARYNAHPKNRYNYKPGLSYVYTNEWARECLAEKLKVIKGGLVLAATPSDAPHPKWAALLKEQGFKLLADTCYKNPNYLKTGSSSRTNWSPDGYSHWIHLWVKDLGGVEKCGPLTATPPVSGLVAAAFPACCGLRVRSSTGNIVYNQALHGSANPNAFLAVTQIPRSELFPKGWKRFAVYSDFKWGINLGLVKHTQECPHEFDLSKLEAVEAAESPQF